MWCLWMGQSFKSSVVLMNVACCHMLCTWLFDFLFLLPGHFDDKLTPKVSLSTHSQTSSVKFIYVPFLLCTFKTIKNILEQSEIKYCEKIKCQQGYLTCHFLCWQLGTLQALWESEMSKLKKLNEMKWTIDLERVETCDWSCMTVNGRGHVCSLQFQPSHFIFFFIT